MGRSSVGIEIQSDYYALAQGAINSQGLRLFDGVDNDESTQYE
jgi:hypothetical protein